MLKSERSRWKIKNRLTHVNKLTSYPAAKLRWVSSGKRARRHLTGGLPSPPAVSSNDVIEWGKFKEQKSERLWEKIFKCYKSYRCYRCYILPTDIPVAGGIILITLIMPIILIKNSLCSFIFHLCSIFDFSYVLGAENGWVDRVFGWRFWGGKMALYLIEVERVKKARK